MLKLRRYLAGHQLECVLAPLFKMLEALLQLLVPLVMADVIDVGIASGDTGYILRRGALLVVMGVAAYAVAVVAQYFSSRLASGFGTAMRNDLFRHVMDLSREDVDRLGRASLVTRITNDSQQVQDCVNMIFRLILRSPFVTTGALVSTYLVDGAEATVLLVAVIVAFVLLMTFMGATTRRYHDIQEGLDDVLLKTTENLEGTRVLRAFRRERDEKETFSKTAKSVRTRQVSTGDLSAVVNPLTYTTLNLGLIALLWLGGVEVDAGSLTQGQLVALVSYVNQILVELVKLASMIIQLSRAQACARRINEVFETEPTQEDGTHEAHVALAGEADADVPAVTFEDVSFSYPGAAGHALEHVSFELMPGQTLGVIGGTGSGKSTLASLIMRFYDATEGTVRVGADDVCDLTRRTLRQEVAIVEQNPSLFSGTIGSNLRWGDPEATDEELEHAVKTAQATEVVASKEGALEGEVEQFGRNFSGGQRQRLAVARTLVRRPHVLVLDDASSALDFATDARLRRAISKDFADAAVITISQRVGTVRGADRILVLDGGRMAGLGTHEELLESCPVYREICESQLTSEEVSR